MMIKKVGTVCFVVLLIVSVFGGVFGYVVEGELEEESRGGVDQ